MAGDITATPNPCPPGDQLEICYTDSTKGGQTITVTMDNGEGDEREQVLGLDENGHGCFIFIIPIGWDVVQINAPNAEQESVVVG